MYIFNNVQTRGIHKFSQVNREFHSFSCRYNFQETVGVWKNVNKWDFHHQQSKFERRIICGRLRYLHDCLFVPNSQIISL